MPINHHLRSVILLACVPSLMHAARASGQMATFYPPGGCISVYMEGQPISKTVNLNGILPTKCYAHDEKEGGYWVTWTNCPISSNGAIDAVNRYLNQACESAIAGMNATESARYSVNLQKVYPGRQMEGVLPNAQSFRMRMFLVGNRLYQLTVIGSQPYLRQNSPNQFLSSLSIASETASSSRNTMVSSSQRSSTSTTETHQPNIQAQSTLSHQDIQEQQKSDARSF